MESQQFLSNGVTNIIPSFMKTYVESSSKFYFMGFPRKDANWGFQKILDKLSSPLNLLKNIGIYKYND